MKLINEFFYSFSVVVVYNSVADQKKQIKIKSRNQINQKSRVHVKFPHFFSLQPIVAQSFIYLAQLLLSQHDEHDVDAVRNVH
jgi:hypothetical protein